MLDLRHIIDGESMRVMSKYPIIVEDCKLATGVNLGSATLAKVSRKLVLSVLGSSLECLAAV